MARRTKAADSRGLKPLEDFDAFNQRDRTLRHYLNPEL
jgi:hypothetical protein